MLTSIMMLRLFLKFAYVFAMMSKRSLGFDLATMAPAKRFRHNAADLFLSNSISGSRAASLFSDARAAGTRNVRDLAVGNSKNVHRNLLKKLLKDCKWPKLYESKIRVYNRKTKSVEQHYVPFLLPHEIIAEIRRNCDRPDKLFKRTGMDPGTKQHLEQAESELGLGGQDVLGIGLWLDGVTCRWDRFSSYDMITMSFPGLQGRWKNLRIPLVVLDHA